MKNGFLFLLVLLLGSSLAFRNPPRSLVGRWQQRWANGAILLANFRPDGSYEAFVDGKAFVRGHYSVRQDTVALNDTGCRMYGHYQLTFFAEDSVRFTAIQDSCAQRRRGTNQSVFGRLTPGKP
ncbi:hypothetical protein [Hymenobacter volaticus]|uniref:DUF2147 domain-containing protein n=1 Tax=Hymenobacter volaticus TaxID=2932254 RepID=A0ABY4GF85_9BACT|nr:hypothetical protein [Hymenobacter volaticus]UOQ69009.1 hypothetical protein MUN86_26250 [Hymenobacter volaticus]